MQMAKSQNPIVRLLLALVLSYGVLFLTAFYWQKPVYLLNYVSFGLDERDFLQASRDFLAGVSPYARERFFTPPLSALLNLPLTQFDDEIAVRLFFVFNLICIFASLFVIQRACALDQMDRFAAMALPLLASPTLMLIQRGNIDGVVALLVACALAAVENAWVLGIAIGLAMSLKAYPAILLVPLAAARNYKALLAAMIVAVIPCVMLRSLLTEFIHGLLNRASAVRINENLSVFVLFHPLYTMLPSLKIASKIVYVAGMLGLIAYGFYRDTARRSQPLSPQAQRLQLASYLVFVVNIPSLVYLYSGIATIMLFVLFADRRARLDLTTTRLLFFGSLLELFPARSFDMTLGDEGWVLLLNFLPPLGSALLLAFFYRVKAASTAEPAAEPTICDGAPS
jgi:hypothetical protein